ncbi:hypothetical protein [[Eubacterium] cellulosolvens]
MDDEPELEGAPNILFNKDQDYFKSLYFKMFIFCAVMMCILPFLFIPFFEQYGDILVALFYVFSFGTFILMFPVTIETLSIKNKPEDWMMVLANGFIVCMCILVAYSARPRLDNMYFLQFAFFQSMAIVSLFYVIAFLPIKRLRKLLKKNYITATGILIILLFATVLQFLAMAGSIEQEQILSAPSGNPSSTPQVQVAQHELLWDGYLDENQEIIEIIDISELAPEGKVMSADLAFTLRWTDENDASIVHENQPDGFQLVVVDEAGTLRAASDTVYNDPGSGTGEINLQFKLDYTLANDGEDDPTMVFEAQIQCSNCGDQETAGLGLLSFSDEGNDWQMACNIEFTYRPN